MGSGLEGFDFSHEGVKRVVGLCIGFVSVIASAPYRFLYLKQRIHDYKKKKKKSPVTFRCQIHDSFCGYSEVLELGPRNMDVVCCDERVCHVTSSLGLSAEKLPDTMQECPCSRRFSDWGELAFLLPQRSTSEN